MLRDGRGQLLCAIVLLLVTGAVLALTGSGADSLTSRTTNDERRTTDPPPAELDPDRLARLSLSVTPRVAKRVERIRGLRFKEVPTPRVVTSSFLRRLTEREQRRSGSATSIGADEAESRIVGLLEPGEQLEDALTASSELAAAAYDTRTDRLYVVSDAVVANRALIEFTIAHELNHALEDQLFGLPQSAGIDDDAALAELALTEGTATSLMTEYAAQYLSATDLLSGASAIDASTGDVPQFVVDQLTWVYLGGQRWVDELRELAGDWKLVDYALSDRPPRTTEQILDPEAYTRDERPATVEIGDRALRADGWRRADAGVLGEYVTSQMLAVGGETPNAPGAADGWNGDRYELWRRDVAPGACGGDCRSNLVLAISWRWDSADDAQEFATTARDYAEIGLGGERQGNGVWAIEGGSLALAQGPEASALVFAADRELAESVADEQPVGALR